MYYNTDYYHYIVTIRLNSLHKWYIIIIIIIIFIIMLLVAVRQRMLSFHDCRESDVRAMSINQS